MKRYFFLIAFFFPVIVHAGAVLPQLPLGARFVLTPEAKIPVNQAAIDVMDAYQTASGILGQAGNAVNVVFEFLLNVCLNEGLCDGAYIKGKPLPPTPKGQTIDNEVFCTNSSGCCSGAFPDTQTCFYGHFISYSGLGDAQFTTVIQTIVESPACVPHEPVTFTIGGPAAGIMSGYKIDKYWGCYPDQLSQHWTVESYVNFPLEEMDISQVTPGSGSPAAQNTAQAYNRITQALAVPGLPASQVELLNKGLTALTAVVINGSNVAISAGVSSTTVTGVSASNSPSGNVTAPVHVVVDNLVLVKYQGDDQALPSVSAVPKKIRKKTFSSKYAEISALRSSSTVNGLLNKFQLPVSTATVQTQFCFNTNLWGNHCIDLAASGIWPVIYLMRFFVVASALIAGYFVIFA